MAPDDERTRPRASRVRAAEKWSGRRQRTPYPVVVARGRADAPDRPAGADAGAAEGARDYESGVGGDPSDPCDLRGEPDDGGDLEIGERVAGEGDRDEIERQRLGEGEDE